MSDGAGRALAPLVLAGNGTVHVDVESESGNRSAAAAYRALANESVVVPLD